MLTAMTLNAWSTGVRNKVALPLRVELRDGQYFDLSSETPRVTIRVPKASSLRYLLSPSLYKLGRRVRQGGGRSRADTVVAQVYVRMTYFIQCWKVLRNFATLGATTNAQ